MNIILYFFVYTKFCTSDCQVINEAMRCGNIVKFVHRKALKDVKFRGINYNYKSTVVGLRVKVNYICL